MTEKNPLSEISPLSNTLFFTSLKNLSFDYTLPLKSSLNHFCREQIGEASRNLFEYLCYKIVQKQITEKGINEQVAIISEKFLLSKDCITNLSKLNASQKKFIFIPIFNTSTHKWNAIIFVHLDHQILQYKNKTPTEPIVAKIISSNINSEEDDYLLNTTMDKIENSFNFTSPEDIQFEVDSINICDQPNTSVFLLNFIEGLVSQENDTDIIMNYIMKLYDESSNTNSIGSNNYFVSFNKENVLFQNLIENYINEIKIYAKNNGLLDNKNNDDINLTNIFELIKFQPEEEDEIESEEEALKIVEKNNEEALKQMEEQELFFTNNMNPPFILNMGEANNSQPNTILGLIQEVENESDEDTEQNNNINNKSLIKRDDANINTEEEDGNNESKLTTDNKEKNEDNEDNNNRDENIIKDNNLEQSNDISNGQIKTEKENNNIKDENIVEEKNIDNNDIKKSKINNKRTNNNNKKINYRNIQSENKVNISMPKLSNNLEKMKNEIISNLSKENKALRASDGPKNNTLEKLKILTEGTNENNILSKSLTNSNIILNNNINENENTTTYNVINLQRNQKYNNSSFYLSKGINTKNKNKNINNNQITKKEDELIITNDNSNMNYFEDKSNIIKNKKKEAKNETNSNEKNNLICDNNYNKIKNINTNLINNINEDNIKNIKKITGKSEIKANTQISQKNKNISKETNKSNNCNRGKNTIIINETSNNNTVINFIEIKNNFDTNNSNNISDNENEIPEDGVINKLIETYNPNKTLSRMNKKDIDNDLLINKNKTFKGKSVVDFDIFSGTNPKDIKLTLLNNYLYGSDSLNPGNINTGENNDFHHSVDQLNHCKLDDENIYGEKIEKEKVINIKEKDYKIQNKNNKDNMNENNIQKKSIKKLKYRGGPEKKKNKYNGDNNNIELLKEYKSSNNCSLNMSNNLNCGCAGINEGCFIF